MDPADDARSTYLVESYVAGLDPQIAAALDTRVRVAVEATRAGSPGVDVSWCGSVAILGEETYSLLVASAGIGEVRSVCRLARISCDHVAEVRLSLPQAAQLPGQPSRQPRGRS